MGGLTGNQRHVAEAVSWPLPWGPVMRGVRVGTGPGAALFLHEPGTDLDAWRGVPALLAHELPLTVVSCDLPGHGLSDDPWELNRLPEVVRAVVGGRIQHARSPGPNPHPNPSPIAMREGVGGEGNWFEGLTFLIAAGATATAALVLVSDLNLSGLVCLSPAASAPEDTLPSSPHVPKLIVAGSHAENDLAVARRLGSRCGGWTVVTGFPVAARGTGLLAASHASHLVEAMIAFLRDCTRRSVPARATPPRVW